MKANAPPKKVPNGDWHPADIKAALEKAGWTFRQLSIAHGYHPCTLVSVLRRHWPKAERLVADAIGQRASDVWPSRYTECETKNICDRHVA